MVATSSANFRFFTQFWLVVSFFIQVVDYLTRGQFSNLKKSKVISFQDLMDKKAFVFERGTCCLNFL